MRPCKTSSCGPSLAADYRQDWLYYCWACATLLYSWSVSFSHHVWVWDPLSMNFPPVPELTIVCMYSQACICGAPQAMEFSARGPQIWKVMQQYTCDVTFPSSLLHAVIHDWNFTTTTWHFTPRTRLFSPLLCFQIWRVQFLWQTPSFQRRGQNKQREQIHPLEVLTFIHVKLTMFIVVEQDLLLVRSGHEDDLVPQSL